MAVVRVNDHPLLTVNDDLVIIHENFETHALVFVRSLTSSATVTLKSGLAIETLGAPTTVQLTGLGVVDSVAIPIGGTSTERVTQVSVSKGQVEVSIVSPTEFRSHLTVQKG